MPKVKMLQGFTGAIDGHYNPRAGAILEVSVPAAFDLVANGYAEPVAEKKRARKKETASKGPAEAAMRPQAEPRDG